ncbi:MAG: TraR/DksA C4-type zinc finger protein [Candidatus Kerfeldbacteria bacterium]|nr:TraR/DksA C4-type zinc finger protein [Candidatus Kerfeldbacteria bacterium]
MSHTLDFINEMQLALEQELQTLNKDLSSVSSPDVGDHVAGDYAPIYKHSDEVGDENSTLADDLDAHAVNVDVTATLEARKAHVEQAIAALEAGTYGVCAKCEQDISEERLMANPAALLCMSCAQ